MKINLNDSCSVILTEAGAAELNRQSQEFVLEHGLRHLCHKHYAGERHRVQLWILFEEFGASTSLTAPTMFEGLEIEVEVFEMSDGKYFYRDSLSGEKIEITKEQYELLERMSRNKRKEESQ